MFKYFYKSSVLCSLLYLFAFIFQSQLFGEEFVNNEILSKEGVYSCSFETGYELTPLGITTMKRGNFTFTRTVEGLLFNGINDIIGYHRLSVEVWNYQDSFRFMNDVGTTNFFHNSGMFFYTDTDTGSITAISGSCRKAAKLLT